MVRITLACNCIACGRQSESWAAENNAEWSNISMNSHFAQHKYRFGFLFENRLGKWHLLLSYIIPCFSWAVFFLLHVLFILILSLGYCIARMQGRLAHGKYAFKNGGKEPKIRPTLIYKTTLWYVYVIICTLSRTSIGISKNVNITHVCSMICDQFRACCRMNVANDETIALPHLRLLLLSVGRVHLYLTCWMEILLEFTVEFRITHERSV